MTEKKQNPSQAVNSGQLAADQVIEPTGRYVKWGGDSAEKLAFRSSPRLLLGSRDGTVQELTAFPDGHSITKTF